MTAIQGTDIAAYPVTLHMPHGQADARPGTIVEVFVSLAHPDAEHAVIRAAERWSAYLRDFVGMELHNFDRSLAVRGDVPVLLMTARMREVT